MNVIELYQNNLNNIEKFDKNINSNLNVKVVHDESKYDDEWLCKMEETIRYLDNILRNPNRFIVNDEEIVKIELARRITVDSIKHLSKNTNLIQDFNKKTGEVRPSKILNINKEESFNTYENRFIYTLINNMKMYIERKKNETGDSFGLKDEKSFNYAASSKMGKKKIDISLNMKSHLEESTKEVSLSDRITKLEEQIRDLTSSDVYKSIAKLHVAPVVSPIKKTNLILKNTNFQYALDLWNYMQSHMESSVNQNKYNKNYQDNSNLKEMMDESFALNYLIMETLNKDNISKEEKEDVKEKVISNMVNNLLSLDDVSLDEILKKVGAEYTKVMVKNKASMGEIEKIYKDAINKYTSKIDDLKVVSHEENIG